MDFLPCNLITGAVFGALCLASLPAFAVAYNGLPQLSWHQDSSGNWSISQLSPSDFGPNAGSFSAGSSSGVIETVNAPDLLINSSGDISIAGNIITASRSLTIADLAAGAVDLLSENPYGAAIFAGSLLLPLLTNAYQSAISSSSSTPDNCTGAPSGASWDQFGQWPYAPSGVTCALSGDSFPRGYGISSSINPQSSTGCDYTPISSPPSSGDFYDPSCSSNGFTPLSSSPAPTLTPAQMETYLQNNPSTAQTAFAKELADDPFYQQELANAESNSPSPILLPSPLPYTYNVPAPDQTITGSPTVQTSTDPSTGQTTKTTTTPSYDITGGPDVTVKKNTQVVTQTCTSTGSCSTTNTTNTSSTPQPKVGTFTSPTLSAPTSSALTPTPFALNLPMPSQSSAVCPSPLTYSVFSTDFTIPLTPLCTLATDVRPYVESLGAVGAGIIIFK